MPSQRIGGIRVAENRTSVDGFVLEKLEKARTKKILFSHEIRNNFNSRTSCVIIQNGMVCFSHLRTFEYYIVFSSRAMLYVHFTFRISIVIRV